MTPSTFTSRMSPTGPGSSASLRGPQEQPEVQPQELTHTPPWMFGVKERPIVRRGRLDVPPLPTGASIQVPAGAQPSAHGRTMIGQVPMRYAVIAASVDQAYA